MGWLGLAFRYRCLVHGCCGMAHVRIASAAGMAGTLSRYRCLAQGYCCVVHGHTVSVVVTVCTCVAVLLPCPSVWWLLLWKLVECCICVQLLCKLVCIGSVGRFGTHNRPIGGVKRGWGLVCMLVARKLGLHERVIIDSPDLIPDPTRTGREGALTLF